MLALGTARLSISNVEANLTSSSGESATAGTQGCVRSQGALKGCALRVRSQVFFVLTDCFDMLYVAKVETAWPQQKARSESD